MGTKALLTFAGVAVAFLAIAGYGFASQAGGCSGGGKGCAVELGWENASDHPSNPTVTCSVSPISSSPTSTLTVAITKLAPGENCAISASLVNLGQSTAYLKETVSIGSSPCTFTWHDNLPSSSFGLKPGKSLSYSGTLTLVSGGSLCENHGTTFTVTITGLCSPPCEITRGSAENGLSTRSTSF